MEYILGQINFSESFGELLTSFLKGVPGVLYAIIILLAGLLISKLLEKVTKTTLVKLKVDKLGEQINEIDIISKANFKFSISSLVSKILYYFAMLFFMVVAVDVLKMDAVSELVMSIFHFIPKLIVALIILIFGILLADGLKSIILTACNSLNIPSGKLIANFVFYFLFINVLVVAVAQTGIQTDFLSTNISILIGGVVFAFAIGYGLATKSTMANFLASFYSKSKFNIGDIVTFDGVRGQIIDIDNSSIILKTESSKVIIPLSKMAENKIEIHN